MILLSCKNIDYDSIGTDLFKPTGMPSTLWQSCPFNMSGDSSVVLWIVCSLSELSSESLAVQNNTTLSREVSGNGLLTWCPLKRAQPILLPRLQNYNFYEIIHIFGTCVVALLTFILGYFYNGDLWDHCNYSTLFCVTNYYKKYSKLRNEILCAPRLWLHLWTDERNQFPQGTQCRFFWVSTLPFSDCL